MEQFLETSTPLYKVRLYQALPLAVYVDIILSASASHYLITVMRHNLGDKVAIFNGIDGEWLTEIIEVSKKKVVCRPLQCLRPVVPLTGVQLIFAPLKPYRQAFLIEKATELGVAIITPIISQHSHIRNFNINKAISQAIEAAEQCERLTIPRIDSLMPLVQKLDQWQSDQPLFVGVARGQAPFLPDILSHYLNHPLAFLIGPEGGFSTLEMQRFEQYPFIHKFSLGDNILRAETAALACLTHAMRFSAIDQSNIEGD